MCDDTGLDLGCGENGVVRTQLLVLLSVQHVQLIQTTIQNMGTSVEERRGEGGVKAYDTLLQYLI